MVDLVVRGGRLVLPEGMHDADLAVEGERIVQVGPELPGGREEIDARGRLVLPAVVDVHVHFNEPGRAEWEGAATGSRALAAGGGTVFVDMPLNSSPCTLTAEAACPTLAVRILWPRSSPFTRSNSVFRSMEKRTARAIFA